MNERIHQEWGSVYYPPKSNKAHLFEDCQYIKQQDVEPKDIDKYPVGYLDFCSECKQHFRSWRKNTKGDSTQCQRCGEKGIKGKYCMDCAVEKERTEARKRI